MSWAPWACSPREKRDQSFRTKNGPFLLAVANDDGDISFLFLSSPYTHMSTSWNCTIVNTIDVIGDASVVLSDARADTSKVRLPDIKGLPHIQTPPDDFGEAKKSTHFHPSLFKSALEGKRFIDHIAWGPWDFGDVAKTVITFSRDGIFYHCVFEAHFQVSKHSIFAQVIRLDFRRSKRQESDGVPFGGCSVMWHRQVSINGLAPVLRWGCP